MISEFFNLPIVAKFTHVLFEFIAEFGGGRGDLHDDLARFTMLGTMFFVAYLISKYSRANNTPANQNEAYLTLGFLLGAIRGIILFFFTGLKIFFIEVTLIPADQVSYYFSFFQPTTDHALNFLCVGILSLSLLCYVTADKYKASEYIKSVYYLCAASIVFGSIYFTSELVYAGQSLVAKSPVCLYWHFITFIVVAIPTIKLLRAKSSWLSDSFLLISCCWLFYDFASILNIALRSEYTLYLTPLKGAVYNLSIPIFIFIYLKQSFIDLEFSTNEAKLLASDREFIIKGFSHEIRTPLMALSGFLKAYDITNSKFNKSIDETSYEKLKRGCPKGMFCNRIVEEGVPEMRTAVRYISNILDNLSEYGRDSSKQAIDKFELTSLTGVGVKYSKFTDEAKLIPSSSIVCKPLDKDVYVTVSPSKYLQIVQNLIRNAIRAVTMPEMPVDREPIITIETTLSADGKDCIICVGDNGIGMSLKQQSVCTDKYWTTKNNGPRTNGLGLYFVKLYMEEFGGQVVIDSKVGVGTNICLIFKINT